MKGHILNQRYQLEKQLGQGGFATVWLAHDQRLNRPVAVKMLHAHRLTAEGEKQQKEQFWREAQAVAQLSHAHVVQLYDLGEEGSQLYLVMEYLPQGDLAHKLHLRLKEQKQPFSLAEAVSLLTPIAQALEMAHQQKLVHRDVKPQNILFAADSRPVLTDFGLVRVFNQTVSLNPQSRNSLVGTPEYMDPDPEQPAGAHTDLYALAVVLFELVTGQQPFKGDDFIKTMMIAMNKDRQLLRPLLTHLPEPAQQLLLQGLAVKAKDRPGQLLAWFKQLQEAGAGQLTHISTTPRSGPSLLKVPEKIVLPYMVREKHPLGFEWCLVPKGEFLMGDDDEKSVIGYDYWLARYPVTNAQYELFIEDGGYQEKRWWLPEGWRWRAEKKIVQPETWKDKKWNGLQCPVVDVNWYEAMAFCAWASAQLGYKVYLPSEQEWEKGARGVDGRKYPWGNKEPNRHLANYSHIVARTSDVGSYSPQGDSPYGCADMAGNVWEWTADIENNSQQFLCGGSWDNFGENLRSSNRLRNYTEDRFIIIGFRCGSTLV